MKSRLIYPVIMLFTMGLLVSSCAKKVSVRPELLEGPGYTQVDNNLHQIDGPPPSREAEMAFRLYRSGAPSRDTFAKWCDEYKIKRVIILSGTAEKNELAFQEDGVCPDIEVVYDFHQTVGDAVSDSFLEFFDQQIEEAREDQVGILLRCETGSHRAGRLSAYYQMKYQDLTAEEAIAVMDYNGMMMPLFDPTLRPQVRAMADYIKGKACSQKDNACVAMDSERYMP